jgi:protein-disulfide isomerase
MSGRLTLPVGPRDHTQGPDEAPVTLVEYGDYECPYCGMAYPIVKLVQKQAGKLLRFAYRNFPLTEVHPHSEQAAEAAESAGAHGRFWPMHDMLFENQQALGVEALLLYAKAVGVDPRVVATDLANHTYLPRVREDFMSGVRSGVNGTPSFFINGLRFDGDWTNVDSFTAVIASAAKVTT